MRYHEKSTGDTPTSAPFSPNILTTLFHEEHLGTWSHLDKMACPQANCGIINNQEKSPEGIKKQKRRRPGGDGAFCT
ncbi:hypothetical protein BH09PAT1_BH09PAT1_5100 [soil metagenome]